MAYLPNERLEVGVFEVGGEDLGFEFVDIVDDEAIALGVPIDDVFEGLGLREGLATCSRL